MTQPSTSDGLRVGIVGAGPSGLYALRSLTRLPCRLTVDVFDTVPTPHGLLRYGVAPDHPKTRSVIDILSKPFESACDVNFFGNVHFGSDLTRADLEEHYHAIVYATGAQGDRRIGIPGEDLHGSRSAREFVSWYCGHPSAATDHYALDRTRSVVVIGAGNVALDVARMLARSDAEIAATDVPRRVLEAMRASRVTDIHVLARRGPAEARFTPVELRELGELVSADVDVRADELVVDSTGEQRMRQHRKVRQNVEMLRTWSCREPRKTPRRIHLRFLWSPVRISGDDIVTGVVAERNTVAEDGRGTDTARYEHFDADLVLRAVGYETLPLPDVPFDVASRTIPHENGRVLGTDGKPLIGEYVVGWAKRGPAGVIGTNKADAAETVASLAEDMPRLCRPRRGDTRQLRRQLTRRGVAYTDWSGWLRIDAHERAMGRLESRERVRLADRESLVRIAACRKEKPAWRM